MFNILVRHFVAADEGPEVSIGGLKGKLKRFFERFKKGPKVAEEKK